MIVVPGYGPVLPGRAPETGRLNLYGRINSLAAAMLCQIYHPHKVIVSGARTGGNDKPSEAQLMAQFIKQHIAIPTAVLVLEEQATNTILNFVYAANIIDESLQGYKSLLVVAMGFHLPRIQEICSLLNLNAHYLAVEAIVALRSPRHHRLLQELLNPALEPYARTLRDQDTFLRALKEIPDYWLPHVAELRDLNCLRSVLAIPRIQGFL